MKIQRFSALVMCSLLLSSCGSDDNSESSKDSGVGVTFEPGTVPEEWKAGYCTATVKSDAPLTKFSKELLKVKANQVFLLTSNARENPFTDKSEFEIQYPTPQGFVALGLPAEAADADCPDGSEQYSVVAANLTLYSDESLKTVLCEIPRGDSVKFDSGGYSGGGTDNVYEFSRKNPRTGCPVTEEGQMVGFSKVTDAKLGSASEPAFLLITLLKKP